MNSERFGNVLFLWVLAALIFSGWPVRMVRAEHQKAGISAGDAVKAGDLNLMLLNHQGYKKNRKGPVAFTHKKHGYEYRVLCWDCHHDYKDGRNVWLPWGETKGCNQCHDPVKKEPNKIMLQKAFHYQCKGCHKELAEKKMKTGAYRKCGGCHLKKEGK